MTDNSALVFNRSDTPTFAGSISGSGRMTQAGSGTLTLTGTNTYTGGTTVSAGTLQIGAGGTSGSIVGPVTDNSALVFNRSDTPTFAGSISGTGTMTQAGSGTLILTGTNTYTGGTTISAGTLQIGAGGSSGSIVGNVTDNSALAFNRSDTPTFAGRHFSGTGTLTQAGSGTTDPDRHEHLQRRHDHQRRHAADRHRRQQRQHRRRRDRQRRAGLQPLRHRRPSPAASRGTGTMTQSGQPAR